MSHSSSEKEYFLITNVVAPTTDAEIDLHAEAWKLPYSIDDADLTFDGKPLSILHEEDRYVAEQMNRSRDKSRNGRKAKKASRGRSRHSEE